MLHNETILMLTRTMELYFISVCSLTRLQWSSFIFWFFLHSLYCTRTFGSTGDLDLLKKKACICIQKIQTDFLQYKTVNACTCCLINCREKWIHGNYWPRGKDFMNFDWNIREKGKYSACWRLYWLRPFFFLCTPAPSPMCVSVLLRCPGAQGSPLLCPECEGVFKVLILIP